MKSPVLSRRNLLLGGAAVGALALGVGTYAATAGAFDFFKAMLRAQLPGVHISDQSIHAFADETVLGRNEDFAPKLKLLSALTRTIGFNAVAGLMKDNYDFEKFNRDFLTLFLLGSNFFAVDDPTVEEIVYSGYPAACPNPFAQFEAAS